jgi:acetylornithine deacetylase/succinyl-diaminopimelate desuccinylase-like protein
MTPIDIHSEVRAICDRGSFQRGLVDFLIRICEIDTSPAQGLDSLRQAERRVFRILSDALAPLELPGGSISWQEISPAIRSHPAFSQPYYAPGSAEEVYRARGNLLYLLDREPAAGGHGVALNAHIDTVAPFFPPALSGDVISGRGAADDKGNVAVILGTLQVLAELEKRRLVALKNKITAMFVIDEETGGNGSLDLALDRRLKQRYESMLVLECTGTQLHPANRGAVFIRCAGRLPGEPSQDSRMTQAETWKEETPSAVMLSGSVTQPATRRVTSEASHPRSGGKTAPSLAEAFAFAILELLDEGEAIRGESNHPLFPHRPVQTCTGILGPFGLHPSAICSEVSFDLAGPGLPDEATLRDWIESGIRRYVARYGDKTQVVDPATGVKKVERHYDLDWISDVRCRVTVHGASGHMGSLPQNDAAIAKWAYIAREIVLARRHLEAAFALDLPEDQSQAGLIFEGAQGFLPTHPMEEIKARTRSAFLRGVRAYLAGEGLREDAIAYDVTFDKLHNEAFACDPDSPTMRRARRTASDVGLAGPDEPVRGWEVSCDARLFAGEHPGMPVITTGAGSLEHAHSDREHLRLADMFRIVRFVSLFTLRETGTIT